MTLHIRAEARDTALLLRVEHSTLEFLIWRAGFRLTRPNRTLLHSSPGWGDPVSRLNQWQVDGDMAVLTYTRGSHGLGRLIVTAVEDGWHLVWDQPTRDTFNLLSGGHWYGQGELIHQHWPLERMSLWEAPFITWDNGPTGLGSILTPAWITSSGVALLLEKPTDALLVGFNAPPPEVAVPAMDTVSGQSIAAARPNPALPGATGTLTVCDPLMPLNYWLLVGADARSACQQLIARLGKPTRLPPDGLLRAPIWTTWARYKTFISQDTVIRFAEEICEQGFPGSTMEIDDKWQVEYGDAQFDPVRFPDPAAMVRRLNELGFAVTVWTTPFLHPNSRNGQEAVRHNFIVRQPDGSPYPVKWWQGLGYLLDVSNPAALDWFAGKLHTLQQSVGLAGYKFDAGEANYMPADALTHSTLARNEYSVRWVEFGAQHFPYCEVRCGWYSQHVPILFRQWDKFSTWGLDNGLASVVTTALALATTGYPFTLPDMIGGNAYHGVNADKELLIRWTQASAPMLAIQFSLAPWDFDAETVEICRKYANLHVELYSARIAAAQEALESGAPVIRPMFWAAPSDPDALAINDQYMLGDTLLAAPVLTPQTTQRDVYLPAGYWRDYWSETTYEGGRWLRAYPAPLDALPLFMRTS